MVVFNMDYRNTCSISIPSVSYTHLDVYKRQEGGLGFIHKNMSIEEQANQVDIVKRNESGMISNPCLLYTSQLYSIQLSFW